MAEPYLKQGITNPSIDLRLVAPLVQTRLNTLTEIPPMVDFFDRLPEYSNTLYLHKKMKTNEENSLEALQLVVPVFQAMTEWSFQAIHDALLHLAEAQGLKNGRFAWLSPAKPPPPAARWSCATSWARRRPCAGSSRASGS